ncbi:hypothetical protein G6F53_014139 [Rhizopus delemar]|nr:hypothetical protein G6F53_014139 [Rhizopus delemar]
MEHGVAKITAGQVGIREVQLHDVGLAERHAAQQRAHQQAFLHGPAQAGDAVEIGTGQLAALELGRRQASPAPVGVVQVAVLEHGVAGVGRGEAGLAAAATHP